MVNIKKCAEVLNEWLDGEDCEAMVAQLRSLVSEGEITQDEYDFILSNWDDLLEEEVTQ